MRTLLTIAAIAAGAQVTPVQKVIALLNGMVEKGKSEKHLEQVQFTEYKQFCDDTNTEKTRAIEEAGAAIEQLQASIQKGEADAAKLGREIATLDEDISVCEGDEKAATEVRKLENADYMKMHKDYTESVGALERAVAVLKKQPTDTPQKELLAQVGLTAAPLIPEHAKKVISQFLAQGEEDLEEDLAQGEEEKKRRKPRLAQGEEESTSLGASAPDANAYEFQSQGVIDMLEKLHDKFEDERTALEKEETTAKHQFDMLVQDLTAQIQAAEADHAAKTKQRGSKKQHAAADKGDLADTTATRTSDKKYLDELVATCAQKAADFESRQKLRADELEAVEKAIEILSSGAVSGNAKKHLPVMLQKPKPVSFLQLAASATNPNQARVAEYLRQKGDEIHSRVLSALATRVAEDPFVKVKKMIKDLIERLMEEASEESEHKGWCDSELSSNEQQRKEKTAAVETLHAEIDQLTASIAKTSVDISDLQTEISDIDANVQKIVQLRSEEKVDNAATIHDAQEAQAAVSKATLVLKEFYEKAGGATSLVQKEAPEIFDTPYQGMQSENGGVVGMLEVILSDFARLEADTSAAEATSQREFDNAKSSAAENRGAATKDLEHKETKRTNEQSALAMKKGDLAGNQKELDAKLAYYAELKPACIDAGVNYEDRVERRKEEIESLQQALKVLSGETLGFLQK